MSTPAITPNQDFQYVKLPDGSYGKFSANASDDVIKQAIAKDFPSAFAPQDNRTGLQRFLDSAGIPRHVGNLEDVKQGLKSVLAPEASPTSPGFGQTLPVVGPMLRAQRETFDQPGIAAKAYGSIPVVGPAGYRAGQQLESGDYAGAAGSALNILTQMLGMKGTNLPTNLGSAATEAGNLVSKAAPAAGKAAGAATVGLGAYKAIAHGNPEYLLTALAQRVAQRTAEGAVGGTGSLLQRLGGAMNPDVPTQFGNPSFSSATISDAQSPAIQRVPITPQEQPQTTLPNATYLRDDIRSISQQPPQAQPDLLEGIREHLRLSKIQEELNAQTGSGADIVDQRMAQYAKTPWENQSITVPAKVTVGSNAASDADTSLFQKARSILGENASISQVAQLAQKMKMESQVPIPQEAAQYLPQPVTNQSNLSDLLTRSIRMARSRK